jgi:hypothetical protein
MAFSLRKVFLFIGLLALIGSVFGALTQLDPARKSSSAKAAQSVLLTRASLQLLQHSDGEIVIQWECPDIRVQKDDLTHRIKDISIAGAALDHITGIPGLPILTQTLDCLPGGVSAVIVDADADNRVLGEMAATPEDIIVDSHADSTTGGSIDGAAPNLTWQQRSTMTPLKSGMWPPNNITIQEAGVFRGHRLVTLRFYPVQVDAEKGVARVLRRAKIRITMPGTTTTSQRLPDRPSETELVRGMLGPLAQTALPNRATEAFEGRGANQSALDDGGPYGGRWKLIVRDNAVFKVTAQDLRFAGCPVDQITAWDTHIRNHGHEIPIYFHGEADGHFDENDYIEFYGEANEKTYLWSSPELYQDPWTADNCYWLSWGDGRLGLRLAAEDATWHTGYEWTQNELHGPVRPVTNVRTTVHYEKDQVFDRLTESSFQWANRLQEMGPLGIYEDHWFYGDKIPAMSMRDFTIGIPNPDPSAIDRRNTVVIRAALQGFSWASSGIYSGHHRAIIYLNGQTARGLSVGKISLTDNNVSWEGQTPIIVQTRSGDTTGIVTGDLQVGVNTLSVAAPGDGIGGTHDVIYPNWFEVEYDRQMRSSGAVMAFPFDGTRGDTFAFDVRGFFNRNIEVWKIGQARLTNVDIRRVAPADEVPGYAARIQLISDQPYNMLFFDDRYPRPPAAIVPETSTRDLRTMGGAEYLIIYHDSFAGDTSLARLFNLRLNSFHGSADTIRVSQIYEQFNNGIVNPEAIHNFLKYAYDRWTVRPTHVCLVGDGIAEMRLRDQSGNMIPSLYSTTLQYGIVASDMVFGLVSGPPWDIAPDIAIGRISCRSATELATYVEKVANYESGDPELTDYTSPYHNTILFVCDRNDPTFNFVEDFSEPAVRLLPDYVNVQRVYLDSVGEGPLALSEATRRGAVIINYNGHGGGGVWSQTQLLDVPGVRLLRNSRRLPFITNFTCFVGAFDARNQSDVLGEAFLFTRDSRQDPVGAIGVYSSTGVGWALAGQDMQQNLFDWVAQPPGMTIGEIVQQNKIRFWGNRSESSLICTNFYSMMMMMTLLGDPGVRLALPQQTFDGFRLDSNIVHSTDTVMVSGTLPWDPAGTATSVFLMPFNGETFHYVFSRRWNPATQETSYVAVPFAPTTHVGSFNPNQPPSAAVSLQNFDSLRVPMSETGSPPYPFYAPQGHIVVYAADPGQGHPGSADYRPPRDAMGSIAVYHADSLVGMRVSDVHTLPYAYIYNDSSFQIEGAFAHRAGLQRVKARGIFRPAHGAVVLDTVDMTQVSPGIWRTPPLPARHVDGGAYRVEFFGQPPGQDLVQSQDFALALESLPDYYIKQQPGVVEPGPRAGAQPMFYVPVANGRDPGNIPRPYLPVRLTAWSDSLVFHRNPPLADSIAMVDSFVSDVSIVNPWEQATLMEVLVPASMRPLTYHISVDVNPGDSLPESDGATNTNNFFQYLPSTGYFPNLFPATNALGTYLARSAQVNVFHRFWKPGAVGDTMQVRVLPGSLPVDSTTLIYLGPDTFSAADLATLAPAGLKAPDSLHAVTSYRVVMTDSIEPLAPGGTALIAMNFRGLPDTTYLNELAIFEQQAGVTIWHKLPGLRIDYTKRDSTLLPGGFHTYSWSGRISAHTNTLGKFAIFRYRDVSGPTIDIAVDGMRFTPHSILPSRPEIFANLFDYNGVDRTPGKFRIAIDRDTVPDGQIAWSDSAMTGGHVSAVIRPELPPGNHTLWVMATDNNGNADSTSVAFEVRGTLDIDWAINYPNPFRKTTTIAYQLTDITDDFVEIRIFTVSGRRIRILRELDRAVANYREMTWDGTDDAGKEVANGVYFARIKAKQGTQQVEKIVKLAKVR